MSVGMWSVLLFLFLAVFLGVAGVGISRLISPQYFTTEESLETFECGVDTRGSAWVQFRISYFMYALIFILFDVEAVFLIPLALVFQNVGMGPLIGGLVFLIILTLGLVYEWKEGALEWE